MGDGGKSLVVPSFALARGSLERVARTRGTAEPHAARIPGDAACGLVYYLFAAWRYFLQRQARPGAGAGVKQVCRGCCDHLGGSTPHAHRMICVEKCLALGTLMQACKQVNTSQKSNKRSSSQPGCSRLGCLATGRRNSTRAVHLRGLRLSGSEPSFSISVKCVKCMGSCVLLEGIPIPLAGHHGAMRCALLFLELAAGRHLHCPAQFP